MNVTKFLKGLTFLLSLLICFSSWGVTSATWVTDTSLRPTSRVGILYTYFPKQGQLICTASLIGPKTIVTAGHCVYDRFNKQVATSAVFMKGMGGMQFNGKAVPATISTAITPHPKFMSNSEAVADNWDIGVITLKDPLGKDDHFKIASSDVGLDREDQGVETAVGILGYDGFYDGISYLNEHPELSSAPTDKLELSFLSPGETLHKESRNVLGHPFATVPGYSGGPLIVFSEGDYKVFAVHKGQQQVRKYKFTPGGIFVAEGSAVKWKLKLFVPLEREVTVATGFSSSIFPWLKSLIK